MQGVLNLSKTFRWSGSGPFGSCGIIPFKRFTFPGGEEHIVIDDIVRTKTHVTIATSFTSSSDIMAVHLAADAIRAAAPTAAVSLLAPYFPYARQDRRMVFGEPFAVKVMADMMNHLKFKNVFVLDPHSSVMEALVDNIRLLPKQTLVNQAVAAIKAVHNVSTNTDLLVFVSPDAGAEKKTFDAASKLGLDIIYGAKHRDVRTGIISADVRFTGADPRNKVCVIMDDIIDGGMTFINLAKALKNAGARRVYLVVSHGLMSKGVQCLSDIDAIYTTDSVCTLKDPKINILPLEDLYKDCVETFIPPRGI